MPPRATWLEELDPHFCKQGLGRETLSLGCSGSAVFCTLSLSDVQFLLSVPAASDEMSGLPKVYIAIRALPATDQRMY